MRCRPPRDEFGKPYGSGHRHAGSRVRDRRGGGFIDTRRGTLMPSRRALVAVFTLLLIRAFSLALESSGYIGLNTRKPPRCGR